MTWPLAIIIVPLVGAVVVSFLRGGADKPRQVADRPAKLVALAFSLVTLALIVPMWLTYEPHGARLQQTSTVDWIPTFGIHLSFGIDGIALVMIAVIAVLVPLVIALVGVTDKLPSGRSAGGYLSLILVQQALTIAVFAATDVFLFYVLFEIMLVPMYFLIGGYGGVNRQYAAVKFFLYSFLGGLIMLASAIGAYAVSKQHGQGTFDWQSLVDTVSKAPTSTQIWLFAGFFVAFAIKAPLVPFHTWLPDAAAQAPIGVAVLVVGVLDKVGTFGFLRYSIPMFPDASRIMAPLVLVLAVIGVLYGSILAAGQRDVKRFIAYVSIAHFGFIALGIFAFTTTAGAGAAAYMLNHSLATGMLIVVIGMLIVRGRSTTISDYGGMQKLTPVLAAMLLIAGLSTLSLPGTNSFVSEFLVLLGSWDTQPVYTGFATVGMVLAAVYVLWLYQRLMTGRVQGKALTFDDGGPGAMKQPTIRNTVTDLSWRELVVLAPMVVLVIGLGFYQTPVLDAVTPTVQQTLHSVEAR